MACRLTPQAEADLDQIWDYIFEQSGDVEIARREVASVAAQFLLLADYPKMGRARDSDLGSGRRSLPVGRYVIVYRVVDEFERSDVLILRVVHGSRDMEELFES
jgi:toxin ParE1/3/4